MEGQEVFFSQLGTYSDLGSVGTALCAMAGSKPMTIGRGNVVTSLIVSWTGFSAMLMSTSFIVRMKSPGPGCFDLSLGMEMGLTENKAGLVLRLLGASPSCIFLDLGQGLWRRVLQGEPKLHVAVGHLYNK